MRDTVKKWGSVLYGLSYVWIGIMHFVDPLLFTPLVPAIIGAPLFWVYVSGIAELALGIAVCIPRTRPFAARIIVLMLLVLYTANINMWLNDIPFNGHVMTTTEHVFRAFMQLLLVTIALWLSELRPQNHSTQ